MTDWLLPFLLALGCGVLSGWGVGGGTLLLVGQTLLLGVDHRTAQAVNLLFFLPTAALSLWFHRKNGLIDHAVWRDTAFTGTVFALLGAALSLWIDPKFLQKPFGVFLLYSGGSMLRGIVHPTQKDEKKS